MLTVLNIDELFAEETQVTALFKFGALGVAEAGSMKASVEAGDAVAVPLWLVPDLFKRQFISFDMPDVYNERHRRKFNAGAECMSLRNRAPFFYEVGIKCVSMPARSRGRLKAFDPPHYRGNSMLQDVELSSFLSRTFRKRYEDLISKVGDRLHVAASTFSHPPLSVGTQHHDWRRGARALLQALFRGAKAI